MYENSYCNNLSKINKSHQREDYLSKPYVHFIKLLRVPTDIRWFVSYQFTDGCLTLMDGCLTLMPAALQSCRPYQHDLCCNSSDCCAHSNSSCIATPVDIYASYFFHVQTSECIHMHFDYLNRRQGAVPVHDRKSAVASLQVRSQSMAMAFGGSHGKM